MNNKNKLYLFALLASVFVINNTSASQNITVSYNPGCNISSCSIAKLVYAKVKGENSSVHYVISTINSTSPTLLLLKSIHPLSTLSFDWSKILSSKNNTSVQGSIKLVDDKGKQYKNNPEVAIYLFSEILGYSDLSNTVDINNPKSLLKVSLKLNGLNWKVSYSDTSAVFNGTTTTSDDFSNYTWLALKLDFYGDTGRDSALPRLAFNEGSTKLQFIMNNFTANFSNPRYSVLVQVSNPLNQSFSSKIKYSGYVDQTSSTSIDDEYAPSVFTKSHLKWKMVDNQHSQSHFWLWRTVCYTQPSHTRKYSTDVKSSKLQVMEYSNSSLLPSTNRLLLSYFGKENADSLIFNSTVINFGNVDDKFYSATHYISWTTLIGLGVPPGDSFSLLVICVLLAGLGLPCLVILVGGVYMCVRKVKKKNNLVPDKSSYKPIA